MLCTRSRLCFVVTILTAAALIASVAVTNDVSGQAVRFTSAVSTVNRYGHPDTSHQHRDANDVDTRSSMTVEDMYKQLDVTITPRRYRMRHTVIMPERAVTNSTIVRSTASRYSLNGLQTPASSSSSTASYGRHHRITYDVCSFTHVCASPSSIQFIAPDDEYAAWLDAVGTCFTNGRKRDGVCACFHPNFQPLVVRASNVPANVTFHPHHWSIHKWVSHHHLAHYAQKLLLFQSTYQHVSLFRSYQSYLTSIELATPGVYEYELSSAKSTSDVSGFLPALSGIVFHDTDSMISEHERMIAKISIEAALSVNHPLYHNNQFVFSDMLPASSSQSPVCFKRLSLAPPYGIFAFSSSLDTARFRISSYMHLKLQNTVFERCPSPTAVLIFRENRRMANEADVVALMKSIIHRDVSVASISGSSSFASQASLFAVNGLIVSTHSSQLVNVMFTHANAAMIEITPEYYNSDFSEYGTKRNILMSTCG